MFEMNFSSDTSGGAAEGTSTAETETVDTAQVATGDTGAADNSVSVSDDSPQTLVDQISQTDSPQELLQGDEASPNDTTPNTENELSDEDIEREVQNAANDPRLADLPWARDKIKQANAYAAKLKADKLAFKQQYDDLNTQMTAFEGKEHLPQAEIERMRQNEERMFNLQAPSASPDVIEKELQSLINPRQYQQFQNNMVIRAFEKDDGTVDMGNVQFLVDRMAGFDGQGERKVSAQDVIGAINALKDGKLTAEDFHQFGSEEEFNNWNQRQIQERQLAESVRQAQENAKHYETQIRESEVGNVISAMQQEVHAPIMKMLNDFKLIPDANDPKVAQEFKQEILNDLSREINQAPENVPALKEIAKVLQTLATPTGSDVAAARHEIQQFINHPQYRNLLNKGISELVDRVSKRASASAYRYKLLMSGYAQETNKANTARPIIGQTANIATGLPNLTADELNKMSVRDRNQAIHQQTSDALFALHNGDNGSFG